MFLFFAPIMRSSTMKLVALIRSQCEIVHKQNMPQSILLASGNQQMRGVSSAQQKNLRDAGES
jgi:hypothetical protein